MRIDVGGASGSTAAKSKVVGETKPSAARQGLNAAGRRLVEDGFVDLPDGRMHFIRYPAAGDGPRIVFCHANGFCVSTYRRTFDLVDPAAEIIALDLRGHGGTLLPADPATLRSWRTHAADISLAVDSLAARFGDRSLVYAGHSLGAVSVLLAAAVRCDAAAMRLIEPVILPGAARLIAWTPLWRALMGRSRLVRGALGRRASFPSRAAAHGSYARKPLFAGWAEGVLEDYLDDGLIDAEAGVALACAPAWEAANFMAQRHRPLAALARLAEAGTPVAALCGVKGSTLAAGARRRLARMGAQVRTLNQAGHLIPMERPADAAAFLSGE